jgi:hypothetical protein
MVKGLRLEKALDAWGTPDFASVLQQELAQLDAHTLHLQRGLSTGNYVADDPILAVINSAGEMETMIHVRAGIFYRGVIGGCSCEDDPTPASEINEYCEVLLEIDKATAATAVKLITD